MASEPKPAKTSSIGRQKIEIKKVEHKNKRYVTFSKRKLGLFRKAAELSILCQAEIAVIVFSEHGKLYSSGHPDPDAVICRYVSSGSSSSSNPPPVAPQHHQVHACERDQQNSEATLRQQYEEAMNRLEEEKKHLETLTEIHAAGCSDGFWWNQPIEEMGLEDLEQFKGCMEDLKKNLVAAAEKMRLINSVPSPPLPPPEFPYLSLLNGEVKEEQAWDYWMGSSSGSSMVLEGGLGHY